MQELEDFDDLNIYIDNDSDEMVMLDNPYEDRKENEEIDDELATY